MLLYEEETGKIIKACMSVFNELGNGFLSAFAFFNNCEHR